MRADTNAGVAADKGVFLGSNDDVVANWSCFLVTAYLPFSFFYSAVQQRAVAMVARAVVATAAPLVAIPALRTRADT